MLLMGIVTTGSVILIICTRGSADESSGNDPMTESASRTLPELKEQSLPPSRLSLAVPVGRKNDRNLQVNSVPNSSTPIWDLCSMYMRNIQSICGTRFPGCTGKSSSAQQMKLCGLPGLCPDKPCIHKPVAPREIS